MIEYPNYYDYINEPLIKKDEFSNEVDISWKKVLCKKGYFERNGIYIHDETIYDYNFILSFQFHHNKYLLVLGFCNKRIQLKEGDSFYLLLEDKTVLSLIARRKSRKNPLYHILNKDIDDNCEIEFELSKKDIEELSEKKIIKWKLIFNNAELTATNTPQNFFDLKEPDITSYMWKKHFNHYLKIVEENVPETIIKMALEDNIEEDSRMRKCYVYLMIDTTNNFYKIGISNNPKYREHTLQSDKPTIELICAKEYPTRAIAEALESALHHVYANKRIRGEWFNLDSFDVEDIISTLK